MEDKLGAIGEVFQQETKYHRSRMPTGFLDCREIPPLFKEYPGAKVRPLPDFRKTRVPGFRKVVEARRSVRVFSSDELSAEHLSFLLWAGSGISRVENGHSLRTAPSAGALYPVETYLVANRIEGFSMGLYHYSPRNHALEEIATGDFREDLTRSALHQPMCGQAAAVILWTGVFSRMKWKYGQRAFRYVYLDAGHIAQNLALAACALGLGSCQIAALFDDEVNSILHVDGEDESILYMSVVGVPA